MFPWRLLDNSFMVVVLWFIYIQNGGCRGSEIGKAEMDSLFRERDVDYVFSCLVRIWSVPFRKWQWSKCTFCGSPAPCHITALAQALSGRIKLNSFYQFCIQVKLFWFIQIWTVYFGLTILWSIFSSVNKYFRTGCRNRKRYFEQLSHIPGFNNHQLFYFWIKRIC